MIYLVDGEVGVEWLCHVMPICSLMQLVFVLMSRFGTMFT